MRTTFKAPEFRTVEKTLLPTQESFQTTIKYADDISALGHGNAEALLKSGQIWAAGVQDLAKQVAAGAQASADATVATFKSLASVKSPLEALDLQFKLARSTFERTLAEYGRIGESSLKLFQDTLTPLAARATQAIETVTHPG